MPPRQLFQTTPSCDGVPRKRRLVAALIAVPGLMPALAHAQLVGEAAQAQPVDAPWGLRLAPQLEEHPLPGGERPATFVLGDTTTATGNQDMAAKGSAEVRRGTAVNHAAGPDYDPQTHMGDAYHQVRRVQNGISFADPHADIHGVASVG